MIKEEAFQILQSSSPKSSDHKIQESFKPRNNSKGTTQAFLVSDKNKFQNQSQSQRKLFPCAF